MSLNYLFNVIKISSVITGGVNIYIFIWVCKSMVPRCAVSPCVYGGGRWVCVLSNKSTSKKPLYVSGLSKLDTLLYKTHIKVLVLRCQGSTFVNP